MITIREREREVRFEGRGWAWAGLYPYLGKRSIAGWCGAALYQDAVLNVWTTGARILPRWLPMIRRSSAV